MGVSFQAAVVFGLGKDFLFESTLGHCEWGKKEDQEFVPKFLLGPMHVCGLYVYSRMKAQISHFTSIPFK